MSESMRRRRGPVLGAIVGVCLVAAGTAMAAPARLVILRHGEKESAFRLCATGRERAQALAAQFLGEGAERSLFPAGEAPAAVFAITLHSMELASPTVESWGLPITLYSVLPGVDRATFQAHLAERTRQAARSILEDPHWQGRTLVVIWEHHHIADAHLARKSADNPATLYQLLGLSALPDVPATWPSQTYDYFWIVDFDPATGKPAKFTMTKQDFTGRFANLPENDWGAPNGLTPASGCR